MNRPLAAADGGRPRGDKGDRANVAVLPNHAHATRPASYGALEFGGDRGPDGLVPGELVRGGATPAAPGPRQVLRHRIRQPPGRAGNIDI